MCHVAVFCRSSALSLPPTPICTIILMQILFQYHINAISAASKVSIIDLSSVQRFDVAPPVKVAAAPVLELAIDGFVALVFVALACGAPPILTVVLPARVAIVV